MTIKTKEITERLEYLRQELRNEEISTAELIELSSLSEHIEEGDVELLEAAGVPEFPCKRCNGEMRIIDPSLQVNGGSDKYENEDGKMPCPDCEGAGW